MLLSPLETAFSADKWHGSDFSYLATYIAAWSQGKITNPYNYIQQLHVFQQTYNYQGEIIMPFSWSPWMMPVISAIISFASGDLYKASIIWNFINTLLLLASFFILLFQSELSFLRKINFLLLFNICMLSAPSVQNLLYSQTGYLGAAGILGLLAVGKLNPGNKTEAFLMGVILTIVSLKPTYFIFCLLILISKKKWHAIFISLICIVLLSLLVIFKLPYSAWGDWFNSLRFFSHPENPLYMSAGTMKVFKESAVLRLATEFILPSEINWKVSDIFWNISLIIVFLVVSIKSRLNDHHLLIILTALFVLLPYLGLHDEIIFAALLLYSYTLFEKAWMQILIAISLFIFCWDLQPLVRLIIKVCIFVMLALISRQKISSIPHKIYT